MEDDGPPEIEAGSGSSDAMRPPVAQLFGEERLDVRGQDAARRQLVAIPRFGQVRLASQPHGGLLDRLFERQVLQRVQRVVVDEDADRPLRGQEVRQPIDQRPREDRPKTRTLGHPGRAWNCYYSNINIL